MQYILLNILIKSLQMSFTILVRMVDRMGYFMGNIAYFKDKGCNNPKNYIKKNHINRGGTY